MASHDARTPADHVFLRGRSQLGPSYVPAGTNERQRFPSSDGQRGSSWGIRPLSVVLKQQTLGRQGDAMLRGTRGSDGRKRHTRGCGRAWLSA